MLCQNFMVECIGIVIGPSAPINHQLTPASTATIPIHTPTKLSIAIDDFRGDTIPLANDDAALFRSGTHTLRQTAIQELEYS